MARFAQPGDWALIGYSRRAVQVTRVTPTRFYYDVGRGGGRPYEQFVQKKHVTFVGDGQTVGRLARELTAAHEALEAARTTAAIQHRTRLTAAYAEAAEAKQARQDEEDTATAA